MSPAYGSTELKGSVYLITSDGRTLSLPIPSKSPNDPLNWTFKKRIGALAALFFFTIVGLVQIQGAGLLLVQLQDEYTDEEMKPFTLDMIASSSSLFMGLGVFLWIPLSLAIGRRPVFLLCTIILMVSTLWAAASTSFYQHLMARCLQGLAVGVSQSTLILVIIDLTYIHQRPQSIAAYWSVCGVVSNVVLAPEFTMTEGNNWRMFYYGWTGPCCLAVILAILLCPETFYRRPPMAFDGRVLVQSGAEVVELYAGWEEAGFEKELPDLPQLKKQYAVLVWMKQLRFWNKTQSGGWRSMRACYPQIVLCFLNPVILWVVLLNALVVGGGIVSMPSTSTALLHGEPYNLSLQKIALLRLAAAAGVLIAWPASGILITKVTRRLAQRNKGYRDAEHYLPSFILPVLFGAGGLILYGLAAHNKWPTVTIFIATGLAFFSFLSLFTANTLWATEAFPRWAAAALVVISGGGFVFSVGLSFAIGPWIRNQGLGKTNMEIGGLILLTGCVGVPIAFWGKRWRVYINERWGGGEEGALRPQ